MKYLQVGLGYRSAAFKRVIADMDDLQCCGHVLRRPLNSPHPVFLDLGQALASARPDFVLGFTPAHTTPSVLRTCVEAGVPVLVETPPAATSEDLDDLADLTASPLPQVAEQYPLMPGHAACLEVVRRGLIGEVSQAQVSSTQTYHAMALLRAYLGVGLVPAQVRAARFSGPLVNPLDRQGWTLDDEPRPAKTVIATVDFGQDRSGVYDFTDNQTRNLLRTRRLLIRGSRGEIAGDQVVRLVSPTLITTTHLRRKTTGMDLDLNGMWHREITLGDEIVWTNPFPDMRWNDDEIAVAGIVRAMVEFVQGSGAAPYPLAQAIFDTRLGLAIDESLAHDAAVSV